jgi:hypothetical protein
VVGLLGVDLAWSEPYRVFLRTNLVRSLPDQLACALDKMVAMAAACTMLKENTRFAICFIVFGTMLSQSPGAVRGAELQTIDEHVDLAKQVVDLAFPKAPASDLFSMTLRFQPTTNQRSQADHSPIGSVAW